jgi:hypothetical protein
MNVASTPLSGRRAEAARNDRRILDAARAVFVADPGAPIAAVAEHAGVGISALYRRYASKEELLRRLCGDGLKAYLAAAEEALADDGDPWEAFARFMRRVVGADSHSLTSRLAGAFTPTDELNRDATTARSSTSGCSSGSGRRPPSGPTSTSTTSPWSSSSSRPSGSGTRSAPASSATATWPCCWRPCAARGRPRSPALRRPGRSSPRAGSPAPGTHRPR